MAHEDQLSPTCPLSTAEHAELKRERGVEWNDPHLFPEPRLSRTEILSGDKWRDEISTGAMKIEWGFAVRESWAGLNATRNGACDCAIDGNAIVGVTFENCNSRIILGQSNLLFPGLDHRSIRAISVHNEPVVAQHGVV